VSEHPAPGPRGQKGERGEPGLPRAVARAVVTLFLINAVLIAGAYLFITHAAREASGARAAQMALCRSSNTARANEVNLWEFLIHLSQPPKTAQGREVLARFEHHLHTVFAPRDCAHLGGSGQGG